MSSHPIRSLYLFHALNSVATTVTANFLFIDQLLLRMRLDLSQIGMIKGVGFWVALTANLLLAPLVLRYQYDRQIAAVGWLVRIILSFGFLLLPQLTDDTALLTAGCTAILFVSMIPSMLANNSLHVVCVTHIPREKLGYHMSRITALWNIPFLLLAIACAWYVDQQQSRGDEAFYRAMFVVFLVTGIFQLPATWLMWRIGNEYSPMVDAFRAVRLRDIAVPFADRRFRALLAAILAVSTIGAMVITFIYPYMLMALKLQMYQIGVLEAGAGLLGFLIMPLWGNLTDRIGGKNVMRLSAFGVALSLFFMVGDTVTFVLIAALLAWKTTSGIFGAGMATGQQYLTLSLAEHGRRNIYIAAGTFVFGCGMLIGALVGGHLLEWLADRVDPLKPYEHYRIYFLFCALAFLLTGNFISTLRDGRRRIRQTDLVIALYRRIRTFGGRRG